MPQTQYNPCLICSSTLMLKNYWWIEHNVHLSSDHGQQIEWSLLGFLCVSMSANKHRNFCWKTMNVNGLNAVSLAASAQSCKITNKSDHHLLFVHGKKIEADIFEQVEVSHLHISPKLDIGRPQLLQYRHEIHIAAVFYGLCSSKELWFLSHIPHGQFL